MTPCVRHSSCGGSALPHSARRFMRSAAAFLAFMFLSVTVRAEPSIEVSASRDRIYLGESLILEIKIGGVAHPGTPDLSAIRNCRIDFLGSRDISHQTIVIVNGQMRREGFTGRSFHFKVAPTVAGELALGPVTAVVDGSTLSSAGPNITVTGVTRQDIVDISLAASRDAVLVDEPFDIRLAVRIRKLPPPYANTDPLFVQAPPHLSLPFLSEPPGDGLQSQDIREFLNERLTSRDLPGFTINEFNVQPDLFDFNSMFNMQNMPARFKLERQSVTNNGVSYWEYGFSLRYFPQTEANYTFGPVLFKGRVPSVVNPDGSAEGHDIFAVGPAAIVRVIPPPERDRPDSYIGAIGTALMVESALDAQTCNVGDPLTLTLSVTGPIQLRNLYPPKLSLQTNLVTRFDIYDDSVNISRDNGTIRYAYTLRPRKAGAIELPPVEVAYYDTSNRQYRIVATAPIPLKVRQAAEITSSQVIGGATNQAALNHNRQQAAMAPAGIRLPPSGARSESLVENASRLAAIAITGPLLFIGTLVIRLAYRHRASLIKTLRQHQALREAKHILHQSAMAPEAFHAHAANAFRRYLELRLNVQAASLTPDEARRILINLRVPPEAANAFADAMHAHVNRAFAAHRPAPLEVPDPAPSLSAIESVENALRQIGSRRLRSSTVLHALLVLLPATSLRAASVPEQEFLWHEANAAMSAAKTPADFLKAAVTYQKLVDLDVRNADLFLNQGTALLLADKPDDAIQVLKRAERYAGARPDITRNLAIAHGKSAGLKVPFTPWSRIVLFWHYGFSCSTRAAAAAIAMFLIGCLAAVRMMGRRRGLYTLFWMAILVFILAGTSILTTFIQENQAKRPVSLLALPIAP